MMKTAILLIVIPFVVGCRNTATVALISIHSERGTVTTANGSASGDAKSERVDQDVAAGKTFEDSLNPADSLNPDVDLVPMRWEDIPQADPGPTIEPMPRGYPL